ncbi:hypothetical protein Vadar_021359 [Vaccinium darrowii]|uniref:Uncharacterized protein n=1 Tax=Vaccinium darrowii TaxID=229202 RepID=A0ACB7YFG0_9ERIC|nr:hypothetical protein Vadar_021359 [Vaccinium darrowii]
MGDNGSSSEIMRHSTFAFPQWSKICSNLADASRFSIIYSFTSKQFLGAVLYIKKEFDLESNPTIEGLIVAMLLIGAVLITTCSGGIADWLGRRPLLIISSVLYFVSCLVDCFLSYCMVFGMSLMDSPSWRLMLGVLSLPSLVYFVLTIFFLPESLRWLVSKGCMLEAKQVLQRLRGREDVSGEMALLVEGLGVGGETSIEEFVLCPANELTDDLEPTAEGDKIGLYGPQEGVSWVARPVTGQTTIGLAFRAGSIINQNVPLMDP